MTRLGFALLLALFAACRKPAPVPPAVEALGAELATFPQLLAPLSPASVESMAAAIKRDRIESLTATSFTQSYAHGSATVDGRKIETFVAYTSPWLAAKGVPLQQMSPIQFLRAFMSDAETEIAMVITPKGKMFFTRAQILDMIGATRNAGANTEDLPFGIVLGLGKQP